MSDTTEKKVLLKVTLEVKQMIADLLVTKNTIADLRSEQKLLDKSTEDGAKQFAVYDAQIRNLTNTAREQQKGIDNTIKAQNAEKDSMDQLKAKLSTLSAEYGKLSKEQRKSAEGVELKNSIKGISDQLKETEGGIGLFTRSVADYKGGIMSALGLNNGFMDTLTKMKGGTKEVAGTLATEGVGAVKSFGTSLLSLLANPIVAILAAIAVTVMMVVSAMNSNGEATKKVNQIMAPFKVILEVVVNLFTSFVSWLLSGVQALESMVLAVAKYIPGLDKIAEKSQQAIELEKEKQALSAKMRAQSLQTSKEELEIAELRNKSRQKDKYSIQDRLKFLQEADALELKKSQEISDNATEKFELRKKEMAEEGKTYKMLTKDEKDAYVQLQVDINNAKKEYFLNTMRMKSQEAQLVQQDAAEKKAKEKEIADNHKQIMAQRLELTKQIQKAELDLWNIQKTTLAETLKTGAEDEKNSYLERYNYAMAYETQSIDIIKKKAKYEIDSSDLIDKLKEAKLKKDFASVKLYQQLIADQTKIIRQQEANDILKIKNDTNKTVESIDKKQIVDALKNYETKLVQQKALDAEAAQVEFSNLSARYAKGKITKEQYEKEKWAITEKYHKKEFDDSLDSLNKELLVANLSKDQKEAIEKAIAETKKKYADQASKDEIKANEDSAKKREDREKKLVDLKKQLYAQLGATIKDIGDGIADRESQRLEEESTKVKNSQDSQKAAIDEKEKAGVISKDQAEREKQKIDANAKKQADELEKQKKKVIHDKAVFDQITSIFNIGLSTAEGVIKAVAEFPLTGGMPFAGIVAAIGGLQIASVLAQPLPKASRGMLLNGPSHAMGGIPIEAEGGEAIINKRSTAMFAPILSALNVAGGGVAFAPSPRFGNDGGYSARSAVNNNGVSKAEIQDAMEKAVAKIKVVSTIEDIRKADKNYSTIQDRQNF